MNDEQGKRENEWDDLNEIDLTMLGKQEAVEPAVVGALVADIGDLFARSYTELNAPEDGYIFFRGRFLCDLTLCFDTLRERFEKHGFTPMIREENGQPILIAVPVVFDPPPSKVWINAVLFIATILSTMLLGASGEPGFTGTEIWLGWPFSLSILMILGAHEMGHYIAARYHKVAVTLPYFLPLPPPLSVFGTLGAVIRLKEPIKNKRALLDIGVAGPLAGMVIAIPVLIYGLMTSEVGPLPETYWAEGNSILYFGLKFMIFGEQLPSPAGYDVSLNQVAWAGWVGFFVTGLNLIPVGQLDGGHTAYVLFGDKAKQLFIPVIMGLVMLTFIPPRGTWLIWILLLWFFGQQHAEPLDAVTPLDKRRRAIAIFTFLLFFFVFVPIPLRFVGG
ncbi:MAG TPA: site-2 protease family protein [Anaerolineae bacterium]|nr:site-2 protease family protein [Anaerolineae bacterium]